MKIRDSLKFRKTKLQNSMDMSYGYIDETVILIMVAIATNVPLLTKLSTKVSP